MAAQDWIIVASAPAAPKRGKPRDPDRSLRALPMTSLWENVTVAAQAAPNYFGFGRQEWFFLLSVATACITGIAIAAIAMISGTVAKTQRTRLEAEMKREMLDRGMSADEIAKVIKATPPNDFLDRWADRQGRKEKT
jgi:hypothetical protein